MHLLCTTPDTVWTINYRVDFVFLTSWVVKWITQLISFEYDDFFSIKKPCKHRHILNDTEIFRRNKESRFTCSTPFYYILWLIDFVMIQFIKIHYYCFSILWKLSDLMMLKSIFLLERQHYVTFYALRIIGHLELKSIKNTSSIRPNHIGKNNSTHTVIKNLHHFCLK